MRGRGGGRGLLEGEGSEGGGGRGLLGVNRECRSDWMLGVGGGRWWGVRHSRAERPRLFYVYGLVAEVGVHCESEVLMSAWWAC